MECPKADAEDITVSWMRDNSTKNSAVGQNSVHFAKNNNNNNNNTSVYKDTSPYKAMFGCDEKKKDLLHRHYDKGFL